MNFQQALHVLTDGKPMFLSRELKYAAAGLAADSEYAGLSPAQKEWAAKKLGFKSAEAMRLHCMDYLNRAGHLRRYGVTSMADGIEYQVTRLHARAIELNRPHPQSSRK